MIDAKLSASQLSMLQRAADTRWGYPGPHGAKTAASLVKRGLLSKVQPYGPYSITDAGRKVLAG